MTFIEGEYGGVVAMIEFTTGITIVEMAGVHEGIHCNHLLLALLNLLVLFPC